MLVRTEAVHFSHPTFPTSPLKLLTQTGSHRLVDAGNPPHRHTACAAAHRACPYHCLVALEAGPSSRRKALIPETKNATVVLKYLDEAAHLIEATQIRSAEAGMYRRRAEFLLV